MCSKNNSRGKYRRALLYGRHRPAQKTTIVWGQSFELNKDVSVYALVGNVTNARAPLYANVLYTTQPNYLASWHIPGLVGRTFRAGVNFQF